MRKKVKTEDGFDVLEDQKKFSRSQRFSEHGAAHKHPVAEKTESQNQVLRPQVEQPEIVGQVSAKRWNEPPLFTWLKDDENCILSPIIFIDTDPHLPTIGDVAILFTFWDNTNDNPLSKTSLVNVGLQRKANLSDAWQAFQKLGNTHMRTITYNLLHEIFGINNYPLHAFVFDHVNSNAFVEAVTIHYGLEQRLRNPPEETDDAWKLRAGIFDAWMGGHIYERQLYNSYDALHELTSFWRKLLLLRYRNLAPYIYNPTICRSYIPQKEEESDVVDDVIPATTDNFRQTFGRYMDVSKGQRCVGHITTVQFKAGVPVHTSFSPSKKEAEEMRALRMGTRPLYEEANSHTAEPIFGKYQRNCYEFIRQIFDAKEAQIRQLLELNNLCGQWIEEVRLLEGHPEKSKVLAMLFRQKSFVEFQVGNYFNSYELFRGVIDYAIQDPFRSENLMRNTIERTELIAKNLNVTLTYTISKDHAEGEISLNRLLTFKWKEGKLEMLWS